MLDLNAHGVNVLQKWQYRSCLYMSLSDFDELIYKLFGPAHEDSEVSLDEIHEGLANYFGVIRVIDFHYDDEEDVGVWIYCI